MCKERERKYRYHFIVMSRQIGNNVRPFVLHGMISHSSNEIACHAHLTSSAQALRVEGIYLLNTIYMIVSFDHWVNSINKLNIK